MATAALAAGAATLARGRGRSAWWGLVPTMWPGALVGLSYDLSEVMAAALLIATVLALRRSRWTFATVTLTASVMTSWWFAGDEVDCRYPTEIILLGFVLMLDLAPGSAPSWPRCSGSCS